jgi:LysM repeat protein
MANPKPIYLPPGVDPTQIERPLAPAGCMKYVWLAALFVGLCGGISLGATIFSVHATPNPAITATITRTPTITPTLKPGVTPTITPTYVDIMKMITVTPGPTITPTQATCWYWHRVIQGETLSGLAAHFGVPAATIQAWNSITNPNRILYGFSIRIQTTCRAAAIAPTIQPTKEATIALNYF